MTPGEVARNDQLDAVRLAAARETCQQRGHWFALGWGGKCLRCGDSKTDSNPAPGWYQHLFGVDS